MRVSIIICTVGVLKIVVICKVIIADESNRIKNILHTEDEGTIFL